ncbi:iron-sulfur cluster-binding domain-containing protein [Brevibacterium aurantiacum]|uniref:Iron-sulfur cluster-binding domain-containing protein n=1 Tax=Brevibacterium aurantiacum TaxID=273384 RepID=A0A556C4I2_BREAU|nr:iron-sulfur cluster-binding domain-containing protein [Brevibacterium aurantiacum]TSI12383.1 iron-sulfur cluster-binding domain-containing protein [Brevibacterium aurantiacum]
MKRVADPMTPLAQRTRGLEMPWNRVLSSTAGPAGAATALGPWHPQEFSAECVETIPEAGDMMVFVFRRMDGAPLAFRSGQYINIDFPVHGPDAEPVSRSYSISSAPTEPWTFSITIKRDPKGLVSTWAHESLRVGTTLEMLGPVGAFHLADYDRRARYLLLAAGAGITPLMSMVRTIHSLPGQADVVLLYHGSAPDRFAFAEELNFLQKADFRIEVIYTLGDREQAEDSAGAASVWVGKTGRLSTALLEEVVPDANGRQVFACGPEGYLNTATDCLREVGVDDTSVFMEFFSGDRETRAEYAEEVAIAGEIAEEIASATEEYYEAQPAALEMYEPEYTADGPVEATGSTLEAVDALAEVPVEPEAEVVVAGIEPGTAAEAGDEPVLDTRSDSAVGNSPATASATDDDAAGDEVTVVDPTTFATVGEGEHLMSFVRTGLNVRVDSKEFVLDAARRAGVKIGANCQEGMCGSCKVVKLDGEVDMNHQGGIRAREIDAGKFLPCCSTATSDLVIDA